MIKSSQTPLTAKRGLSPADKLPLSDWEAAVFDNAALFTAIAMRPRRRSEFASFADALAYVRAQPDVNAHLIYAVTKSGRSMIPDPVKWDEWLIRATEKDTDNAHTTK
jgi:hypothetical protein